MPRRPVDPAQSFPELEEAVLERWRERDVFRASLRRREGAEPWVFYEGPPTANGRPGTHHVLSRAFKDIFPRFQTMRGRYVERKGGWDCHGLPVEITVEKELGLGSKAEIEAYGIAEFNRRCRESVSVYLEEWDRLTQRIGYWVDLDDAYRTMDPGYIEQVWGALRRIWDGGLLYEGHRVVPYCPRCGTALSSHEVAQGYADVTDVSVYVRLGVLDPAESALEEGDVLLAWTTTPWTLPSNAALAVHPDLEYVRARVTGRDGPAGRTGSGPGSDEAAGLASKAETIVVAAALLDRVVGPDAEVEVLERLPGSRLTGARYRPPFDFIAPEAWGARGNTVLAADFVTAEDGTGVVHTAIAFGADDFALGTAAGLNVINPVRLDGTYDERITGYEGRRVRDANADLVEALRASGALWRAQPYEHSYPHCWRCGTPLIYYAKPSWYIATSSVRDALVAANEQVVWHPENVKHGRFGNWLANNVDWAISRERYWGTPLPIWRCDGPDGHLHCVGSFAELEGLSGRELTDPHRPYVDELDFPCPQDGCRGTMRRVPEVIDVWFDSGSMPFAQHAQTLERTREQGRWPADYICEAQDQTRGWFYSLLAVAVLLQEAGAPSATGAAGVAPHGTATAGEPVALDPPRPPYHDVVCLGLILDGDGQKMSKSRGNIVVPWEVVDRFGADALRWYFFTSKQPWDGYRFSPEAIGDGARLFLRTLWNTYGFLVLYENASTGGGSRDAPGRPVGDDGRDVARAAPRDASGALMDRWILSRLTATVALVTDRLEAFDATFAGREIGALVDDLSNWYVRRSRRRFWAGDPAALGTLRECLLTISRLLAPFTPFLADEIYDNLDGSEPSVHLVDWPEVEDPARPRDEELEAAMTIARETVQLGLGARGQARLKIRQPLREAVIVAADREREAIERLATIVRDELNVHELRFVADADDLGSYEVKPNYRALGPRFGPRMPAVAAAVAALDPAQVAATIRAGGTVGIDFDGHTHELGAEDLLLRMEPLEGYQLEREGSHAVALELGVDAELRREGLAREVVHAVQAARKAAGLRISDRIRLTLDGDEELLDAARTHREYVADETLTVALEFGPVDGRAHLADVDARALRVGVLPA